MRIGYYFAVLGIASSLLACGKLSSPAEKDLYKGWVELTATPSDPAISQPTVTYAASQELAMAANNDHPPMNDCKLTDVRHAFILGKKEFSLGEPIEVEYRVWLDGPGTWHEYISTFPGYFNFLVRHEDGTWGKGKDYSVDRGCGVYTSVTKENTYKIKRKVQDRSAVDRPGRYDLFCLHMMPSWFPVKQKGFSPVMKRMPEAIHAFRAEFFRKYPNDREAFETCKTDDDWTQCYIMRDWIRHIEYADAFAHFTIVVRDKAAESVKGSSTRAP